MYANALSVFLLCFCTLPSVKGLRRSNSPKYKDGYNHITVIIGALIYTVDSPLHNILNREYRTMRSYIHMLVCSPTLHNDFVNSSFTVIVTCNYHLVGYML